MQKIIFGLCLSAAILGGPATAAENDTAAATAEIEAIKKSDFLQTQRAMFDKADKDFDGRVSQDEISLMNDELNKPKHLKAFKDLDADNNGFLSLREIEAKHQEFTDQKIERQATMRQRILTQYDQDGDGDISSRELDSYFEKIAEKSAASTTKSAAADLNGKDLDDSGTVSLDEYLLSKTASGVRRAMQARRNGEYLTRDKNGDRHITRSENEAYILGVFEVLDKNRDDQLSASEQKDRAYKSAKQFSLRSTFISTPVKGTIN